MLGRNFSPVLLVTCIELPNSLAKISHLINSQISLCGSSTCLHEREEFTSLNQIELPCSVIIGLIRLYIIHIHWFSIGPI